MHERRTTRTAGGTRGADRQLGPRGGLAAAWSTTSSPTSGPGCAASEPVTLHESTAIIAVADEFTRDQLEGRLRGQLEDALTVRLRPRDPDRGHRRPRLDAGARPADEPTWRTTRSTSTRRQVDMSRPFCRSACPARRPPSQDPGRRTPRRPARDPAQPEVHLRDLRHRLLEPVPARRGRRRRRGAGQGLQPAARLRRLRARQDPPAARDRALRAQPLQRRQGPLRLERGVHQRVHQRDPRRPAGPVQAPLPRRRRAADRRHPVPGGQDPDPGGVLPHLQHPAQRQQADRADLRPRRPSGSRRSRTGCATGSSGA